MGTDDIVYIAVLGPSGTGKTTFINLVSNSKLNVGHSTASETREVQVSQFIFKTDSGQERTVALIDTPGFNDTNVPDMAIVSKIAGAFQALYNKDKILLHGVLYFLDISHVRVTAMDKRNLVLLRQLCGDSALRNVVFVTTMWETTTPAKGQKREDDYRNNYLKDALAQNAHLESHKDENDINSARKLISDILQNTPIIFQIVDEMANKGKTFDNTSAGQELNKELNELQAEHKRQIADVQKQLTDMKSASKLDKQSIADLTSVLTGLKDDNQRYGEEMRKLKADGDRQTQEHMKRIQDMMDRMALNQNPPPPPPPSSSGGSSSSNNFYSLGDETINYLPHHYLREGTYHIINHKSNEALELAKNSEDRIAIRVVRDMPAAMAKDKMVSWYIYPYRGRWSIKYNTREQYLSYHGNSNNVHNGTTAHPGRSEVEWQFVRLANSNYLYRIVFADNDDLCLEKQGKYVVFAPKKRDEAQYWKLLSQKAAFDAF
ncbi:hypothetical protein Hypma_003259 [Hypsizygus marmoreus]|uniref:AIG1-type G domain-containing protein n=1 Tax=Hypsizygus marmoreus TaxID=39966 RepID=A0A369K772_HYPMA|nr:hypothetical protein Hypma_003259 [Hypsizygus marmoreus]